MFNVSHDQARLLVYIQCNVVIVIVTVIVIMLRCQTQTYCRCVARCSPLIIRRDIIIISNLMVVQIIPLQNACAA